MSDLSEERDPVEVLAEEFVERRRKGESPSIQEYAERHPALANRIRSLFPALMMLEDAGQSEPVKSNGNFKIPDQIAGFRLVREIGRGGMGIVYEAVEESLGRRVALKILAGSRLADPTMLTRFEQEASTAARLHHTNIVPVYSVGKVDDLHFFAMQFVEGVGLDVLLAELRQIQRIGTTRKGELEPAALMSTSHLAKQILGMQSSTQTNLQKSSQSMSDHSPVTQTSFTGRARTQITSNTTYFRNIAKLLLDATEAVAHAHAQNVIHRDIKPSNLLIDSHGTVYVSDFGLAKIDGSVDLTRTGLLVGTPRYMAPERLDGIDGESVDIYALGATLYEAATLRPLFSDMNREQLLIAIRTQEPVAPRSLVPGLPKDLETVIHKSLAKEPARRYRTAHDLASDLRRFLNYQPILARRATVFERLTRWAQRNPSLATATAAIFLTLTIGLAVTIQLWLIADRDRKIANDQTAFAKEETARADANRKEAERQRDEANANLQEAVTAVETFYTRVSSDTLLDAPGMQPLRRELLESARVYYLKFLDLRKDNLRLARQVADAHYRVAVIEGQISKEQEALASFRAALKIYEDLAKQNPKDLGLHVRLANTRLKISASLRSLATLPEAMQVMAKGQAELEALLELHPNDPRVIESLADCYDILSRIHSGKFEWQKGLDTLKRSLNLYEKLPNEIARRPETRVAIANSIGRLGDLYAHLGEHETALIHLKRCRTLLEALCAEHPNVFRYEADLAECLQKLSEAFRITGQLKDFAVTAEQAVAIYERLVAANPAVKAFASGLAASLSSLARSKEREQKYKEALPYHEKTLRLKKQLHESEPSSRPLLANYANGLLAAGQCHAQLLDYKTAEGLTEQAREKFQILYERDPQDVRNLPGMISVWNNIAQCRLRTGRSKEAIGAFENAINYQQKLIEKEPKFRGHQTMLANELLGLATACRLEGRIDDAVQNIEQLMQLGSLGAAEYVQLAQELARGAAHNSVTNEQRLKCEGLCIQCLNDAIGKGFRNSNLIANDPAFASIRSNQEFQAVLQKLKATPASPAIQKRQAKQ